MTKKSKSELLRDFLLEAPLSHALRRSVEALSFQEIELKKPVLDLGCGFGEFSGVVYGKLECGVDISDKDLKIALSGKKYSDVVHADARKLPFRKGQFASVISVSVMEHIEGADRVIEEVNRIMKKGGLFVFSVPTPVLYEELMLPKFFEFLKLKDAGEIYKNMHKKVFQHVSVRTLSWWEKKLKNAGFEIVRKEGTISPALVRLHEAFLIFAFPSQLWRWIFGKRLIIFPWRSKYLTPYFKRFVRTDRKSMSNIFIVARKK